MKFKLDPGKFWIRIECDGDDIERSINTYKHKKLHKKCRVLLYIVCRRVHEQQHLARNIGSSQTWRLQQSDTSMMPFII